MKIKIGIKFQTLSRNLSPEVDKLILFNNTYFSVTMAQDPGRAGIAVIENIGSDFDEYVKHANENG